MTKIFYVSKRKGLEISGEKYKIEIDESLPVLKLKEEIQKSCRVDVIRQWLTLEDLKTVLDDNNRPISSYNFIDGQNFILKDLGPQLLWSTVFYLEYLGPIAILILLYYIGKNNKQYSEVQNISLLMATGHYIKRELETIFVHVFSRDSMPKQRALINFAHYWILFGLNVGLELFIIRDLADQEFNLTRKILLGLFVFFEYMNLMCHITLSNLRKKPLHNNQQDQYLAITKQRGIPKGYGFQYVSCANYLWEVMSWLSFSLFSGSYGAFAFTIFSFGQMLIWAKEKHRRYKKDFGDKYPKNRKAILPFLI